MCRCPDRLAKISLFGLMPLTSIAARRTISAATNLRLSPTRGGVFEIQLPGPVVTHIPPLE